MGEEAPLTPPVTSLYVDGCPGCAIERRKESNKAIPYKELFFVAITNIASALPISSLFPFLYYMIEDLHVAKKEQDIGFYAGFLGASYFVGRFLSSLFWGVVADRIGRKPIIVFSVLSVVVFNTLFGLSTKYWMAITTRLVLGALNGMLAPIKVSTAWGIGLIVGPSIGGYLARILSLWTISDRKYGGLSFSSKEVGQLLAVSGAGLMVYQIFIYRPVHKFLGCVNSCRASSALSIPLLAVFPFMTHLSGYRLGLALYFATIVKAVVGITILTGTSLLQNYAVPQSQRGAANGIAATAMSFFMAIGPAGAGALFSWTQKRQHAAFFPGDHMLFFVLNVVQCIGLVMTFKPFLAVPEHYDLK